MWPFSYWTDRGFGFHWCSKECGRSTAVKSVDEAQRAVWGKTERCRAIGREEGEEGIGNEGVGWGWQGWVGLVSVALAKRGGLEAPCCRCEAPPNLMNLSEFRCWNLGCPRSEVNFPHPGLTGARLCLLLAYALFFNPLHVWFHFRISTGLSAHSTHVHVSGWLVGVRAATYLETHCVLIFPR